MIGGVGLHFDRLTPDGGIRSTRTVHDHEIPFVAISILVSHRPYIVGILVDREITCSQIGAIRGEDRVVNSLEVGVPRFEVAIHHQITLFRVVVTDHMIVSRIRGESQRRVGIGI